MREKLEWTHYESWEGNKKILAIGDSIIWGARSYLEKVFTGELGLTTVVSAHGVNEDQFIKSVPVLATLNDSEFEAVYFNNGLHARGQDADEYARNYEKALLILMEKIPAKKWILGLSTPISNIQTENWVNTTPITLDRIKSLKEQNDLVIEFNKKVKEIAEKLGLPYFDAYALMEGRDDLKVDPCHYNEEGKKIIADGIISCILDLIK